MTELWSPRSRPKLVVSVSIPLPPFAVWTGIAARVLATIRSQTHFAIWLSYGFFIFHTYVLVSIRLPTRDR